ncbi:MAG TPA: hypothetical protein DCG47_13765 [Spirochaetaceae bacterium]|nr:hypothetical protein [Spirochaetaceae bacterium]
MAKARIKFLALILAALPLSLHAQGLRQALPGLDADALASIVSGAIASREASGLEDLRWLPPGSEGRQIASSLSVRQTWPVLIESAYFIPQAELPPYLKLSALNALGAISTLSGVTYFSHNRNRETVLFDNVYRVESAGGKKRLPDLSYASLPRQERFTIHLSDSNFGSCWYTVILDATGAGIRLSLSNAKPIGIAIVRAFSAEELFMELSLMPVAEGLAVYAVCAAAPAGLASSMVDMYSAVLKRLDSVRGWAVGRLKQAR